MDRDSYSLRPLSYYPSSLRPLSYYSYSLRPLSYVRTVSAPATAASVSILLVSNIDCPSCVSHAEDVLRSHFDIVKLGISIVDQRIRVEHNGAHQTALDIAKELGNAAFDVQHVTTYDTTGQKVAETDLSLPSSHSRWSHTLSFAMSNAEGRHIEDCDACQTNLLKIKENSDLGKENPSVVDIDYDSVADIVGEYEVVVSIGGMTCASCSGMITKELESLDIVRSVNVNLMANNATVHYVGPKNNVDKIVEAIEDVGYEASADDVKALNQSTRPRELRTASQKYRASLSIDGMTCGSCVGTITRGLQELEFVTVVNVDLLGKSGQVEFDGKDNLQKILETIDDIGYNAEAVNVEELSSPGDVAVTLTERTVTIAVAGMFCEHCPDRVMKALEGFQGSIAIPQRPNLKNPHVVVTYTPHPPDLTVRNFISAIDAAHEAFKATIYHPPSIEQRSRAMQHREQWYILYRLIFLFIVAIPTFVIGIVFMSLVPPTNTSRMYLEQPVWSGDVTRAEWAMLIMTTPVMFFGADVFHRRAFKELRALWRPGSKVPILRRFYRFGSMNLLISAGTAVAYFSSLVVIGLEAVTTSSRTHGSGNNTYFDSVTFLSFFILIGKFLEAFSKAKTGDAVAMLSNLRPSEALLVESAAIGDDLDSPERILSTTRVPVDLVEIGDVVNVPHGASPPTDGTVEQNATFLFDESSLTGESKPVKKTLGDMVFAGSVNVSQPVRIRVTDISGTSMLDRIVSVVREGQAKRAPIERIADVITGYFVPVITLIAIVTFVIWLGLGASGTLPPSWLDVEQGGWTFWALEFAIAVFVVACPCGIGLAAPTALFVGSGLAAQNGILVQGGGEAFQEASKLDMIVFDKTGTLTEGKMKVTDHHFVNGDADNEQERPTAFALSKALEESSNHPIAKAIVDFCAQQHGDVEVVDSQIAEIPGQGMKGIFTLKNGPQEKDSAIKYEAAIGNQALMATLPFATDWSAYLDPVLSMYQSRGYSTAILAVRRLPPSSETSPPAFAPTLVLAVSDPIRPSTPMVLETLRKQHNLSIHVCTGDNPTTALAIAFQLGIPADHVRAGALPADKAAYIRALQQSSDGRGGSRPRRRIIAFVGDGTNDTPALAAADVSIALASGSDVAVSAASFVLLNPDLATVLALVTLARRVFRRVRWNFVWAGVYNVGLVPVAAGVFFPIARWRLGPVWASAAMAASSVSVVCSSLALRLPAWEWRWGRGGAGNEH